MSSQNAAVTLTPEQLERIITTAVSAAVKTATAPTEDQLEAAEIRKAQKEQDKQMRKERAEMELQAIERRKTERTLCSHERTDGTFNVIYIYPGTPDMFRFIYCQSCSAIIRPEDEKPTDKGHLQDCQEHIFDTQLFNRLFRYAVRPKTDF